MRSTRLSRVASGLIGRQSPDLTIRLQQCAISSVASDPLARPSIASSSSTLLAKRHAAYGSRQRPQEPYEVYDDHGQSRGVPASDYPNRSKLAGRDVEDAGGRKAKRYGAGTFKEAFYNDPADNLPDASVLTERLKQVIYPASTSAQMGKPDPYAVLDEATPLLRNHKLTALLDPFVLDIPRILGDHFVNDRSGSVELPVTQKAVGDILAACFHRAARRPFRRETQPYHSKEVQSKVDKVAEVYALYLLDQSVTTGTDYARLEALQEALENGLFSCQHNGSGYRISVPLVAAWVALRVKTRPMREFTFIWPKEELVVDYLERSMAKRGVASEEFVKGVQTLYGSNPMPAFPENLDELKRKLRAFVREGEETQLVDLWRQYRDHIGTTSPQELPSGLTSMEVRSQVLGAFMNALKSPTFADQAPLRPDILESAADEVLSFIPRPFPRHILHDLVANRARVVGVSPDAETGEEAYALDRYMDANPPGSKKEAALKNLHKAWELAHEKGAERDIKLYNLYMEGLGRLGELEELQQVWNEMIGDSVCKELWAKEGLPDDTTYPPRRALNQMIQSSILVAPNGPAVALELFHQAIQPNSAIPCDIITINIVLRHYARKGTLADMQGLFALASRLNLKPDVTTYITLIQGLLRVGQIEMAKGTLNAMNRAGIPTSERLCTLLISDLAKTGTVTGLKHAEDLMREMKRTGLDVGVHAWTALISGYFRGGWIQDGWDAVRRMDEAQLKFNLVTYNLVLQQAGEKASVDNSGIPTTMTIFSRMIQEGVRPSSDTYIILLTPLMRNKLWKEADKVVAMMEKLRFMPDKKPLRELLKKVKFRRGLDWETPAQARKRRMKEEHQMSG